MSNFVKADIVSNPTVFLNYYLTGLRFGASNIITASSSTGYYQLSYDTTSSSNSYQATYYKTDGDTHYKLINLYFYKLIHNNYKRCKITKSL